jgi:aminopeptidase N
MKKNYLVILLLFANFSFAQNKFSAGELGRIAKGEGDANFKKINPQPLSSIADYDVLYHRCRWTVDPAVNYISGSVLTLFKTSALTLDSVHFNLSTSLSVDSVIFHNSAVPFVQYGTNLLSAKLPSPLVQNSTDSIEVFYKGVPPSTGFGSFIQSSHNGSPILWTLSEPYGASDWWPCKNSLSDKADSIDIFVSCPSGNKVASNGLLISENLNGSVKTFHWKHRYPIATYLICFACTNYARFSDFVPFGATTTEVTNYVYAEDSAATVPQTVGIIPTMQLYDTLFGLYPFADEKYGHAVFGWGGGMEHQTMTFVTNFNHELTAHELAHHWFGDKITCGSWEDIWLNEGFATYLSGITYEHMFNGMYWMQYKVARISSIVSSPGGTVWCDDTTSVARIFDSRLSYEKGAMILHTLRWVIGDSAFFAALNNYLNDPALAFRFARTADLKNHFEISSGQNLSWYFNDWFTGEGFPSYQVTWSQAGNTVNLTLGQTQSHPSVSFFELPVPIQFKNTNQDTIIRFNHTFSGESFSVTLPFTVDSVKFDPDLWIISANNNVVGIDPPPLTKNQVRLFPNPAFDQLQVNFTGISGETLIEVYNNNGKKVNSLRMNLSAGNSQLKLDLKDLAKGIYILSVLNKDQFVTKKFIKN